MFYQLWLCVRLILLLCCGWLKLNLFIIFLLYVLIFQMEYYPMSLLFWCVPTSIHRTIEPFDGEKKRASNWTEMLTLPSCGCCRVSIARAFQFQTPPLPSRSLFLSATKNHKFRCGIPSAGNDSDSDGEPKSNYAGVRLEETVDGGIKSGKVRLDSWISSRINGISRARVQSSIKEGLVHVNGRVVDKVNSENTHTHGLHSFHQKERVRSNIRRVTVTLREEGQLFLCVSLNLQ